METIYINLLQNTSGIELEASKVLKASHPYAGRYIATYAIKGDWRSEIRPNVIGRIMDKVMIEEASTRKARRIAEKSLNKFKVFNPLALDFASCDRGDWNATSFISTKLQLDEVRELALMKLNDFLESPRVQAIAA